MLIYGEKPEFKNLVTMYLKLPVAEIDNPFL